MKTTLFFPVAIRHVIRSLVLLMMGTTVHAMNDQDAGREHHRVDVSVEGEVLVNVSQYNPFVMPEMTREAYSHTPTGENILGSKRDDKIIISSKLEGLLNRIKIQILKDQCLEIEKFLLINNGMDSLEDSGL